MADGQSYNTRLRTNSVLLPPRRLRHSPTPPPRSTRNSHKIKQSTIPTIPLFPPPNVLLHPDDAHNKTLIAIGRAMLAVDNRAITIKDLSQLSLDYGLLCQNVSAASQAITTFIRNHLTRCRQQRAPPLLLSLSLTGTPDDDRLAPALHSRSGGTSCTRDSDSRPLTSFRRGTTVWYLSELAGAPCPFKRAGLSLDDIPHSAKRKRDSPHAAPRKLSTPGPAMSTRKRTQAAEAQPDTDSAPAPARLRLKLTLRVPEPVYDSDSSDSDALSSIPDDAADDVSYVSDAADDVPPRDSPCPDLPPYPILSPSIPSPPCTTPATALASPSAAPCAAFLPVPTALSNPPRSRSRSLPFSSASPPPDSEDEDHDFHNSMVGLRRGSVPLKQEDDDDDPDPAADAIWRTPFPFAPAPIKAEPTSAVLPPAWDDATPRWDAPRWAAHDDFTPVKREHASDDERTVLDPDEGAAPGKGTQADPVRVDDVELLGPESVRSREWDAAWCSRADGPDAMDVDTSPCRVPAPDADAEPCAAAQLAEPAADAPALAPCAHDAPFVLHPLRPCDPPVIATIIEGIPVYHTLLAPGLPLLRRIDTAAVLLAPLRAFLGLPPAAGWVPLATAQALPLPHGVREGFLSTDLGARFAAGAGIRAEDVFAEERAEDAEVVLTGTPAVVFEGGAAAGSVPPVEDHHAPADEQDDALFRSFVDFAEPAPAPVPVPVVPAKPAPAPVLLLTASAHAKENAEKENAHGAGGGAGVTRRRAAPAVPVRRSKRVVAAAAAVAAKPVTRARMRSLSKSS